MTYQHKSNTGSLIISADDIYYRGAEGQRVLDGKMFDGLHYDENGKLLTSSFLDYLTPTGADLPRHILTGPMESSTQLNPFGMKGGVGVTSDGSFTPPAILQLISGAPKTVCQEHAV